MIMQVTEVACGIGASRTRSPLPSECRSNVLMRGSQSASRASRAGARPARAGRSRRRPGRSWLRRRVLHRRELVVEVEALRAETAGSDRDLDLLPEAYRGLEVDLDACEDHVHVFEPARCTGPGEEVDTSLLDVGQEDRVVHVAHRIEVTEAHLLGVDELAVRHAPDASGGCDGSARLAFAF